MLLHRVNSNARCEQIAPLVEYPPMATKPKKRNKKPRKPRKPLEQWQLDDAAKLEKIFQRKKLISNGKLTQLDFGATSEIGTQGAVWQYIRGRIPLNVTACYKFARSLGCYICEFSPTLADQILQYAELARPDGKPSKVTAKST